jgi:hypothetical protein
MRASNRETIFDVLGRDPVHTFPARMAPSIALRAIARMKSGGRVLDPMMGSGTVLALARAAGHRAVGTDIDPLAVLISSVWTTPIDPKVAKTRAVAVLSKARLYFASLALRDAFPPDADKETRRFIRYWFDSRARRELAALASAISGVRNADVRRVLWCGFSRLIIAKQSGASRAMDLAHSRPHRTFKTAPILPFEKFMDAVQRVLDNCLDNQKRGSGPSARAHWGDARRLPVKKNSIDLVLTSPPYLNAIDYFRCSKFSLVWMGYSIAALRSLRNESIGTEAGQRDDRSQQIVLGLKLRPKLGNRQQAMLEHYISDMREAVAEVARVLVDGGKAIYVIGENTVRGTYIPNAEIVRALARETGLRLCHRSERLLPASRRYLPPPATRSAESVQFDGRMRREVVMTFRKN